MYVMGENMQLSIIVQKTASIKTKIFIYLIEKEKGIPNSSS